VEWKDRIYIEHGWDDFAEDNGIEEGDTLFISYTVHSSMNVIIIGRDGCEKVVDWEE
jgi:hypothetical protein